MKETTKGFQEEFRFLSNFWELERPFKVRGISYPTIEHYYQAAKFVDKKMQKKIADHPLRGLKKFVKQHESSMRDDWEHLRLKFMLVGLNYKFSDWNPNLKRQLLETGNIRLVEYNTWNDTYWGVQIDTNEGLNMLGRILMYIRANLRNNL